MSETPPPPPPPGENPPPPPPPPPAGGAQPGLEPVGPWPRFGAKVIDYLVLLIPFFIISAVIGGDGTGPVGATDGREILAGIVTTVLGYAYFVYLESTRGQTVGKMALSYRVIGPDGAVPSTEMAARRNAYLLLSVIPFVGGIAQFVLVIVIAVTISSDPFKRGWHDNFAGGTAVVRAR
jgi:uncharacterized RDD family membrane protein YckC